MRLPFVLLAVALNGCTMPRGMNENCNWPGGWDQHARQDRQHLVADVKVAEELAMRYADSHSDSRAAHGRTRSDCEAKLFTGIAREHRINVDAISEARQRLDREMWDAPVHLPLAALYLAVAILLARRIRHRFAHDEKAAAVAATLFISIGIAIAFLVVGHLWDGVVEMIRVGNTHMSYRVERLGWREHSEEVFGITMLLFWLTVIAAYRLRGLVRAAGAVK